MAEALNKEMYNYFTQLNEAEKKSVIQMLKTFLQGRKENDKYITLEQYNKELQEAEEEFERGDYITHDELLKQIKQW
jgi:predicted transcriptional regulator